MKNLFKQFVVFSLLTAIIINTFYVSFVYASEDDDTTNTKDEWVVVKDVTDDMKPVNRFAHKGKNLAFYLLAQCGAITSANLDSLYDNTEWLSNVDKYGVVVKNTTTGNLAYKFDKVLTDDMLNRIKEINKEPENGGYELLKTVPANKISSLYFNYPTATKSMYNLLKDNNGIIGLAYYYGTPCFYKIPENVVYVKNANGKYNYNSTVYEYINVSLYKNFAEGGAMQISSRNPSQQDEHVVTDWNDSLLGYGPTRSMDKYIFLLYDGYNMCKDIKTNPLSINNFAFLVTNSGVSIPVFNTMDDAIDYSISNNLYYTGSDYTGEGKEIIIEFDQIDNITNGYYDDMYILLQQMIENKGGDSLTPEQLQQIVDEVRASFGLLKDEINKGFQQQDILIQKNSSILQNIADALNAFFRQTKEFREYMDKMFRDFIDGQKYTPPNQTDDKKDDNTGTGTGTDVDIGDGTGDTGGGLIKKIYDTVKDGFADVVKQLKSIKRWTALDTVIDGAGLITDIVSFVTDLLDPDKAADAVAEFVANGADALVGVKDLVDGKFPFCIPVDILTLMKTLAHEPETPYFEVPIVLDRYGINEKLVIDFSDFEYISKISRTFLTIAWCFALMNATTKITDMRSI